MRDDEGALALSNDDVRAILDPGTCADLIERGFRALGRGEAANPPRVDRLVKRAADDIPGGREPTYYRLKTMSGVGTEAAVLRVNSDLVTWSVDDDGAHKAKLPAAGEEQYVGFVLLFDPDTGEPLAVVPDGYLQRTRVGATSAVGTKHLARDDATDVGLLGSGWQAGAQLLALDAVCDLDTVRVYSPTPAHREAFVEDFADRVDVDLVAVDSAAAALAGADVVHTATDSLAPVIDAEQLEPGVHISCLGVHEVGRPVVDRAELIAQTWSPTRRIVDDGASVKEELVRTKTVESVVVGDPGEIPRFDRGDEPWVDWSAATSLADIVGGATPGRTDDTDLTLFLERGLGVQFLATVPFVYERALDRGLGTRLPPGLFLQSLVP